LAQDSDQVLDAILLMAAPDVAGWVLAHSVPKQIFGATQEIFCVKIFKKQLTLNVLPP
jgi:hypothetical protein